MSSKYYGLSQETRIRRNSPDTPSSRPRRKTTTDPLFSTTFPAPPRRQIPTLNNTPFDDSDGTSITFRHADSTSRALAALAQAKYDKMERRRASGLLVLLVVTAVAVHVVSSGGYYVERLRGFQSGPRDKVETTAKLQEVKKTDLEADKALAAETAKQAMERLEEEKKKEEKMMFLNQFENLEDYSATMMDGTALFWHIPRSGGSTIKNIMGQCLGLVGASEVGIRDGHGNDPELNIIDFQGVRYVNVDTYSLEGINRAYDMGFSQSKLADVVVSSYFLQATQNLFDRENRGRAFSLLRNPIERAVSMYYYKVELGMLENISLEEYAKGKGIENNWMTRYLVNHMEGELSKEDLEQAKVVLKEKFLIGFLDDLNESLARFMKYNGWGLVEDDIKKMNQENCIKLLTESGTNTNRVGYSMPKKGTQAYALITWQTQFDLKLYEFAKELFDMQTKAWGTKERKKADKKRKKAAMAG